MLQRTGGYLASFRCRVRRSMPRRRAASLTLSPQSDKTYAVSNAFVRDPFRAGVVVNEPGRFFFLRAGLEF